MVLDFPPIKHRAPASEELVRKFLSQGWIPQRWPASTLLAVTIDSGGNHCTQRLRGRRRANFSADQATIVQSALRPQLGVSIYLVGLTDERVWLLDCFAVEHHELGHKTLRERLKMFPLFISRCMAVSRPLQTVAEVLEVLQHDNVVFRRGASTGWRSSSMALLLASDGR